MAGALLRIDNVSAGYHGQDVLRGLSLTVEEGNLVAIVGPNGHGKTTMLRAISGLLRLTGGSIALGERRIDRLRPDQIVAAGVVHVPQGDMLFPEMTVLENLQMGAIVANDPANFDKDLEHVYTLFPLLKARQYQRGGTLSGGEQQMLAIGRALMGRPTLLLLDEPSLGLAPLIVKQIFAAIRALNADYGLTVFLVEQSAYHALRLAHRGYVMVNGKITMSGTGAELLGSPEVQAAYLEGGAQGAPKQGARK